MQSLFYPKSIVLVGASNKKQKVGNIIANNLIESNYKGGIFFVNPNETEILGQPCYNKISQIDNNIDLAIIAIPALFVLQALEQLISKGIKYVIIISSGFKELGQSGLDLENKILSTAKENDVRIIGPNCLGVMNLDESIYNFNATFTFLPKLRGSISFVSQSGALISSILDLTSAEGLGFNKIISLGNKSDIDENELLEYLIQDSSTKIICLYLESFSNGRKLVEIIKKSPKPIILIKGGKSKKSAKAITSHTGSIAGDQVVAKAYLDSSGCIAVDNVQDLVGVLKLLENDIKLSNNEFCILTNAGGMGVLCTDQLEQYGFDLIEIPDSVSKELQQSLGVSGGFQNPIDILGDADSQRYSRSLEILAKSEDINQIIVILTPQANTDILETAKAITDFKDKYPNKLVLPVFVGANLVIDAINHFKSRNIAYFNSYEQAIKALKCLYINKKIEVIEPKKSKSYISKAQNEAIAKMITANINLNNPSLDFVTVTKIAKAFKLKIPKFAFVNSRKELETLHEKFAKPYVLKSVKPNLLHRTDEHLVKTGLNSIEEAEEFFKINKDKNLIIQDTCKPGVEILIGAKNSDQFDSILILGLGGIYAEVINDFVIIPNNQYLGELEIERHVQKTKAYQILNGYRGANYDIPYLVKTIQKISQIALTFKQIKSIDVNPYFAYEQKGAIADIKILI